MNSQKSLSKCSNPWPKKVRKRTDHPLVYSKATVFPTFRISNQVFKFSKDSANLQQLFLLTTSRHLRAKVLIADLFLKAGFRNDNIFLQNIQQSRLTRSAYMTSFLSKRSILLRSSLHMNFWMLNFLFYIWKEHYRIFPLFQKRTLSVPETMQRILLCLSQRIILTWEFKEMTASSSRVETFQIHTV